MYKYMGGIYYQDDLYTVWREASIFDLVRLDFSDSCGYTQYLLGDVALFISSMILLPKWYAWAYWLIHKLRP